MTQGSLIMSIKSEFIRLEHALLTSPKFLGVLRRLNCVTHSNALRSVTVTQSSVIGALAMLWLIADRNAKDDILEKVSLSDIDAMVELPGFAAACVEVGWLKEIDGSTQLVDYSEHNGDTSRKRAMAARRQAAWRERHNASVTHSNALHNADERYSNAKKKKKRKKNISNTDTSFSSGDKSPSENSVSVSAVAQSTTPAAPPELAILEFQCNGPIRTWHLTQRQIDEWTGLYSGVDVFGECRKALAWINANQRKTAKGMPRFLNSWLARSCDRMALKPTITAKGRSMTAQEIEAASRPFIQTFYKANDLTVTNGVHPPVPVEPSPWDD